MKRSILKCCVTHPSLKLLRDYGKDQIEMKNSYKASPLKNCFIFARSIFNKTSRLQLDIASSSYDIITLTETHLDDSISDGEILPSNYTVFRRDRKINGRSGGGVLIATRDYIKAVPCDTSQYDSEFIFVDLLLSHNRKVTFGVFYRPYRFLSLEDLQAALQTL